MSETTVTSGQVLSGVTLEFGAGAVVSDGGLAEYNQVSAGSYITLASGGVGQFNVLSADASETILSGGMASGTSVLGATEYVDGGTASGSYVSYEVYSSSPADGTQFVYAGGVAGPQDVEYVLPGGTAISSVISGGTDGVYSGGVASGTVVNNEGTENVLSGGVASFTSLGFGFQIVTEALRTAIDGRRQTGRRQTGRRQTGRIVTG